MKLLELASRTGARLEADVPDIEIEGAAGLDDAGPSNITFLSNPKYTPRLSTTRAAAVYVANGVEVGREIAVLRVHDPYLAYTRALRIFHPEPTFESLIHPSAVIDS